MPGGGDFVSFFSTREPEFYTVTLLGTGILTKKISGLGVSPGGMVTGQTDTCIIDGLSQKESFVACTSRSGLVLFECRNSARPTKAQFDSLLHKEKHHQFYITFQFFHWIFC